MASRAPETLLELCVARATEDSTSVAATLKALLKGGRVCEFIVMWAIATAEQGETPTVTEFARWWRQNDRESATSWRRLDEFKALFPGELTPERLVDDLGIATFIRDRRASRSDVASLLKLPVAV